LTCSPELAREPRNATGLAEARGCKFSLSPGWLDALVAMELLSKHDSVYRCEPAAAEKLASDSPTSVLASVGTPPRCGTVGLG